MEIERAKQANKLRLEKELEELERRQGSEGGRAKKKG
jgi:hypothetical protein